MHDLDLSICENEPIRFSGAIQPHGALLVIEPESATILAASESCNTVLGLSAPNLLGVRFCEIFGSDAERRLLTSRHDADQQRLCLRLDTKKFEATPHVNSNDQIVLDIETTDLESSPDFAYACRRIIESLRMAPDLIGITQRAVNLFQTLSGFDRVMIYRFDEIWNGEVIAEACHPDIESFLGLNFPASDIPKQARELFQSSRVRQIPDVLYTSSALISLPDSSTIDLGLANLRSVSPIHIEYLTNMEVRASLVGALTVAGRLWGLLTCHHIEAPKYLPPAQRENFSWFCQDLEALLETTLLRQRQVRELNLSMKRRKLINSVRERDFKSLIHDENIADILDVVAADGFALIIDEYIQTCGKTPEHDRIQSLLKQRWKLEKTENLFASSALNSDFALDNANDDVAGALFVSVREHPSFSMIWFRRERRYAVHWGGDPENAHFAEANGRISPRKSFALFLQNFSGQSLPWSQEELDSVVELGALIEIEIIRQEQAFSQTIMDSSPDNIAILDSQGRITAVNNAWRRFAEKNGTPWLAEKSIGLHYQAFCTELGARANGAEAGVAWAGVEAVLNKKLDRFDLDYPCDSPYEPHWFRMHVYSMLSPGEGVAMVHENITAIKRAELRLAEERNFLRMLLKTIPDLVWLKDPNGIYLSCNPAFERFFGACEAKIIGKSDYDFAPIELADFFRQKDLAAMQASVPLVNEEWVTYPGDSRKILFETTKTVMRDSQGNLMGVLGIAHDITVRNQYEKALEDSESRYRTLLQKTTDAILIFDMDGNLEEINLAGEQMLGYCHNPVHLIHAQQIHPIIEQIQRNLQLDLYAKNACIAPYETKLLCSDNRLLDVEVRTTLITIEERKLLQIVIIDLTPRKQQETERWAAYDLQRESLIREVHHRIKNNLQGITGILRNFAQIHPEIASPINHAISKVQSISVSYGLQGLSNTASVRACELTLHIAADIESTWNKPVTVDIPADWTPCFVAIKETVPLALILNELIWNAVKHSSSDAGIRVLLRHGSRPDSIIMTIHNTGLLPNNFGLDAVNCLGNGLLLLKSLLPSAGAGLHWLQLENTVITSLELDSPVVTLDSHRLNTHEN